MSLRSVSLGETVRSVGTARWTERVELVEFYGVLQIVVLQLAGDDHPPQELWISRDCRNAEQVHAALRDWSLARATSAAHAAAVARRCDAALAAWGHGGRELAAAPLGVLLTDAAGFEPSTRRVPD